MARANQRWHLSRAEIGERLRGQRQKAERHVRIGGLALATHRRAMGGGCVELAGVRFEELLVALHLGVLCRRATTQASSSCLTDSEARAAGRCVGAGQREAQVSRCVCGTARALARAVHGLSQRSVDVEGWAGAAGGDLARRTLNLNSLRGWWRAWAGWCGGRARTRSRERAVSSMLACFWAAARCGRQGPANARKRVGETGPVLPSRS